MMLTYLGIIDHVDSLKDNVLGVFPEEFEDVLYLRLVGESP